MLLATAGSGDLVLGEEAHSGARLKIATVLTFHPTGCSLTHAQVGSIDSNTKTNQD